MNGDHALCCRSNKCVCKVHGGVCVLHELYGNRFSIKRMPTSVRLWGKHVGGGEHQ
jgi:hypothetical protein